MGTAGRRTPLPLKDFIFKRYGSFNVFQLLRLLQWKQREAASRASMVQEPERQIRFRADLSAAFPGREVTRLIERRPSPAAAIRESHPGASRTRRAPQEIIEIFTPNYCVASVLGPLPEPYTEWLRDQQRMREHTMSDFLDLFNQRLNALRYELKARQAIGLNNSSPEETPHAFYLASLMGMGQPELAAQMPLPQRAWLGLAGLLANRRKSASTVKHVLKLFLGPDANVKVEQFAGAWQDIEEDDRIALGRKNHALGSRSLLGRRVWDQQARIRILVSAMRFERFLELLPPAADQVASPHFERFAALLRLLTDRAYDCDVRLAVRADSIPRSILSTGGDQGRTLGRTARLQWTEDRGLRLGRTAWLNSAAKRENAGTPRVVHYLVRAFDTDPVARRAA
ncbi:MAG TPA: type VI secretion system baseplate subunit TssG [Paucimonas sp.]|nr:type VI secretion system baseplate subunit TssG [Paucimonas sp.]